MSERLRARFLAAMGLPTALVLACAPVRDPDDPAGGGIPEDTPVERSDLPDGAWSVVAVPKRVKRERHPMPTCPSGDFCVVGAPAGATGHAPAPFDRCAELVPYPHEPAPSAATPGGPAFVGGPDVNAMHDSYSIYFSANWTAHERATKDANACCYAWVQPCPGGRPLRDDVEEPVLAAIVAAAGGWSRDIAEHVRDPQRAQHWARAAQYEHASVAAFAQLSLQLLALAAPAELIARSHRAALDEIEHARLAFTLASAFGGETIGPGPLPILAGNVDGDPIAVLRASVRDGCIAETRAAVEARTELAAARSAFEREVLARIADDEERHAELAFATVAWLVERFGHPARSALAQELERMTQAPGSVERTVVRPCLLALLARTRSHGDALDSREPGYTPAQ